MLEALKDGARLSSVYAAAMEHIEQSKPELLEHFTKTAGYVIWYGLYLGKSVVSTCSASLYFGHFKFMVHVKVFYQVKL